MDDGSPGLVSFSTSETFAQNKPCAGDSAHRVVLDPATARIKRMRSAVLTAGRLIQARLAASRFRWKPAMLTLTYADEEDFAPYQITQLMDRIRKWAKRHGWPPLPFVWVLECGNKHGRLHYHVMIWLPKGATLPKPDKQGWWSLGMTRIEWVRRAVGYLA